MTAPDNSILKGADTHKLEAACKPNSVPVQGLMTVIDLGSVSRQTSSGLPAGHSGRAAPAHLFGLAPDGVYRATFVTECAVSSYLAVSPLPVSRRIGTIGGLFSVALSVAFRRPAVSRHPALRSSDFPPFRYNRKGDRPAASCN